MNEYLISIIMPTYNGESFISESLATIKGQTYKNWELIVVEDGSSDRTEEIVKEFAKEVRKHRVEYIRHEYNQGVSAARNTAMKQAKGEYLAFLDYDDFWKPHHLATAVNTLQKTGGDIVYSTVEMFKEEDGTNNIIGLWGPSPQDVEEFPASLLARNYIASNVVVMKRCIAEKVGDFETNLKAAEDLEYWLRLAAAGFKFVYIPGIYGSYRKKESSSLTAQLAMVAEQHAQVIIKYWHLEMIPKRVRQYAALIYHLKAAKFNLKTNPLQAAKFLLLSAILSPQEFFRKLFKSVRGK